MGGLLHILLASAALSVVHALIPTHWMPLISLSRSEHWSRRETLRITLVTGLAHIASTILFGILVGIIGYRLSQTYNVITGVVAPAILAGLGIFNLVQYALRHGHDHAHNHIPIDKQTRKRSRAAITASLAVAMFFSPCIELEAYFLVAGAQGWPGILTVAGTYLLVTVTGMVLLVDAGLRGIRRLRLHFLDQHGRLVTGLVMILLGVLAYCFKL